MTEALRAGGLFAVTALAEIIGCWWVWQVLREGRSAWLLLPGLAALAAFAALLTLHPQAAGRTYAAYGGVYVVVALVWLRLAEGQALTRFDAAGAALALAGMLVIALQPAR